MAFENAGKFREASDRVPDSEGNAAGDEEREARAARRAADVAEYAPSPDKVLGNNKYDVIDDD
jgi:hypothetical protein